jgi:hypothetical protein
MILEFSFRDSNSYNKVQELINLTGTVMFLGKKQKLLQFQVGLKA